MFRQSDGTLIAGAIYTLLLLVAGWSDLRWRRIPNRLVLLLTISGIAFTTTLMSPPYGLGFAAGGLVTGFLVWLPFYALGWIGAGDVKLAASCGAWLGMHGVLRASAFAAIAGGALALAMLLYRRSPKHAAADVLLLMNTIRRNPSSIRVDADAATPAAPPHLMPYGVALVIGAVVGGWSVV